MNPSRIIAFLTLLIGLIGVNLLSAQDLYVGSNSTVAPINFTSGTNSFGNTYIGYLDTASNNVLTISNSGTLLSNSSSLYVGHLGAGNTMLITDGGVINTDGHLGAFSSASASNNVTVTGNGAFWSNSTDLYVGDNGSWNSLIVSNRANVSAGGNVWMGYQSFASNNSVLITSNSLLTVGNNLRVGYNGSSNSLIISNSGLVTVAGYGYIGDQASSSNNSVEVSGGNSVLTVVGQDGVGCGLYVGNQGSSNMLTVSSGGTVNITNALCVGWTGGSNVVLITGSNAAINSSGLYVGYVGSENSLVISNGGHLQAASFFVGVLGSSNSAIVTGLGSTLSNSGVLTLGNNSGEGDNLTVSAGGHVINNGDLKISHASSLISNNWVLVTDSESLLSNSGTLYVGIDGSGTLTAANGGTVVANNGISIANHAGSAGTLNIGALGGTDGAGTVTAPTITFGSGSGTINFNHTDSVTISAAISDSGNGVINQFGSGTTILTGSNSGFTGVTTITNGTLQFGDGDPAGGAPAAGNFTNNASLVFAPSRSDNYTVTGNISGAGSLSMIGTGTTTLFGTNTYSGNTIVNAGTLVAQGPNALTSSIGTGNLVINNGGTVLINQDNALGYSSNRLVTINQGGTLTINGGNTQHLSPLVLNGGTVTSPTNVGASAANYGTYNLDYGVTAGGASNTSVISAVNIAMTEVGGTLFNVSSGASNGVDLLISGTLTEPYYTATTTTSLVKQGDGLMELSGSNSYTNGTIIQAGTILASSSSALGSGTVTISSTASLALSTNLTISSLVWNGTSSSIAISNLSSGAYLNITGALSLTGTGTINLTGNTLGGGPEELIAWGSSNSYTTNDFSVTGVNLAPSYTNYFLSISSNALWIQTLTYPDLYVGSNSAGQTTNLSSGGYTYFSTYVGYSAGSSNNSLIVSGGSTLLTNYSDIFIGYSGSSNSLVISNAGTVANNNAWIGYGSTSSNNRILVSDVGSLWTNGGDLTIGAFGSDNNLFISHGASVAVFGSSNGMVVGLNADSSNNSVLVTGSNGTPSTLTVGSGNTNADNTSFIGQQDLTIGYSGSGNTLTISGGGHVYDTNGWIGYTNNSSNNTVLVTGSGSLWSNTGDLTIGFYGGNNSLIISNGATVIGGSSYWGDNIGIFSSSNSVIVTGVGSLWTNNSLVMLGNNYGSGNSLVISNGGCVVINPRDDGITYTALALGGGGSGDPGLGNSNIVTVTDTSSILTVKGNIDVSQNNNSGNYLSVLNGASVTASNLFLTYYWGSWTNYPDSSNNYVLISGSGGGHASSVTLSGDTYVGGDGHNDTLTISNGGILSDSNGWIGYIAEATNHSALVTGAGSTWSNSGTLTIGNAGSGNTLTISNGGRVSDNFGYVGFSHTAVGNAVIVDGNLSSWINSGDLYVGYAGQSNRLVIQNGGFVSNVNGFDDGEDPNDAYNSVLVTGSGSRWSNSGNLTFGLAGHDNSLVVSNGGFVSVGGNSVIGDRISATNNTVLVTGNGSLWSNGGAITVGNYGSGTLTISNDGNVVSRNDITIASHAGSTGILNIGFYGGSGSAGTISTPTFAFGSGSGTINFNQTDSFRLTSSITGTGSLNQLGTGTTILSGTVSSFTGSATVLNGTFSLPSGLTVTSLIWNSAATITLPEAGGGHYLKSTGLVTLNGSGANTFDLTGLTLGGNPVELFAFGTNAFTTNQFSVLGLADYMLSIRGNALWISVNDLIAHPTNTIITNTATYPTVTFERNGILTVTPSADLTITAPVNVTNNGTVVLNGVLNTPALTVASGGFLGGNGTLNGNLTNGGVLAPGNGLGTLTVHGNFTQTPGGTLLIEVGNGLNSLLTVNGGANLGGKVVINPYGGHRFQYGDKIIFLRATEITGSFSSVEVPSGFRGRVKIVGDPQLEVIMAPASYTQLAQNRNQSNVATALNSFIPATNGDRLTVSTTLDSLTASQYNQAFNAIMPTFYQQVATIAFNQANAQNMELNQRLWGLRIAEGGGFSMSGLADNYALIQEGEGDGSDSRGKGVLDSKKDILRPGLDNHWGMFVDGNGIFAQANSANMLPGYKSQSGGVTAGLSYQWTKGVATGIYAGYEGSYTKSGADGSGLGTGSSLTDNAVRFGVFGTYGQENGKGFYANALAGGAYHNLQATRVIQFPGRNRTANSAPGAGELDTMLSTGYDVQKGKFTFGPTASLQYTYLGVNSVNETGAQSLNFNSSGWNSSSMLSSLGAHAAYTWCARHSSRGDIVVVPQISLNWQHEFLQNPYAINGNLGGTSPNFSNWSATGIRDYLYTGVGFTVDFAKRWNTSFFYNAAAGNQNLVSQNIFWSAGVKF